MRATTVNGYAFEADIHCVECTLYRFRKGRFKVTNSEDTDENGLPYDAEDGEGNPVHPIFDGGDTCGDCHATL